MDKAGFRKKIEGIVAKVGVPMQVFLSLGDGEYRKPATGMWNAMKKRNDDVEVDVAASFFVGDAAGRHKTKVGGLFKEAEGPAEQWKRDQVVERKQRDSLGENAAAGKRYGLLKK